MSRCVISDGMVIVWYSYTLNIITQDAVSFAEAVLECFNSGDTDWWFTDAELDLCRAYMMQTKEVTDETW